MKTAVLKTLKLEAIVITVAINRMQVSFLFNGSVRLFISK